MSNHKQIMVEVGAVRISIDELIAPMVEEMWKAFIRTESSCQELEPGMAFVYLPGEHDLKRFLDIICDNTEIDDMTSLYRHIHPPYDMRNKIPTWRFDLELIDHNICHRGIPSDHRLGIYILLPHEDIPAVVEKLRIYNELPLNEG